MGKKYRYNLRYNALGSPVKFKHMVTLTNKTQIMFSFPRILISNGTMYLTFLEELCIINLIGETNVLHQIQKFFFHL